MKTILAYLVLLLATYTMGQNHIPTLNFYTLAAGTNHVPSPATLIPGTILWITDAQSVSDCSSAGGGILLSFCYVTNLHTLAAVNQAGGSMTWPAPAGIPCYSGSSSWCTSYSASNTIPANYVSNIAESQVTNLIADLAGKQATLGFTAENSANKGAANGYAPLDSSSDVPLPNIPNLPESQITNLTSDLASKVSTDTVIAYGACGDSTHVCQITTNSQGLVTNESAVAVSGGNPPVTCSTSFTATSVGAWCNFHTTVTAAGSGGNLGATTLATPTGSGLFRVCTYLYFSAFTTAGTGTATTNLSWNNGGAHTGISIGNSVTPASFADSAAANVPPCRNVFSAAGQNISFVTAGITGTPTWTMEVYAVVERLF